MRTPEAIPWLSQASVAKLMKTSQPKVARIEGGDENITLSTLRKLAIALRGKIRLSIEPRELHLPALPDWWEAESRGLVSDSVWTLRGLKVAPTGVEKRAGAMWSTQQEVRLLDDGHEQAMITDGSVA